MVNDHLVRYFFGGFVRLHILYHAEKEAICGIELIEELQRHGYKLSPGTLYPILHHLQGAGLLACKKMVLAGKCRKNYRITSRGRALLSQAQDKLRELFSELVEDQDKRAMARRKR